MRKLADHEVMSLTTVLKMERDSLAVARAIQALISDDDLKKQAETDILATEGRIRGVQQFINENQVAGSREV